MKAVVVEPIVVNVNTTQRPFVRGLCGEFRYTAADKRWVW